MIFLQTSFSGLGESDDEDTSNARKKRRNIAEDLENPLLTDLDHRDKKTKRIHKAELWFEKDIFKNLEDDKDEDFELDKMVQEYKKKGGRIMGESTSIDNNKENKTSNIKKEEDNEEYMDGDDDDGVDDSDDTDSDYDVEKMMAPNKKADKNVIDNKKNSAVTGELVIRV